MKVALVMVVLSSPYWYDRYFRTLPVETAEVVPALTCVSPAGVDIMSGGIGTNASGLPVAGTVPRGFVPVKVVVCVLRDPTASGVVVIEEQRTGDLDPLLAALDEPSRAKSWFSWCTASAAPDPLIWLVADDGRAVLAALPREPECGLTSYAVKASVAELAVDSTTVHTL